MYLESVCYVPGVGMLCTWSRYVRASSVTGSSAELMRLVRHERVSLSSTYKQTLVDVIQRHVSYSCVPPGNRCHCENRDN